ncbi:carboxylesterase family protein [Aestuariibaculum sp. M13]|uniref:carboxylesterase/lipase family protein n=1 Tax=Aestuariibaculum sp. M13 TaxID=2967132 RepID=UPI002159FD0B|nr:carboxylesterase family protein [Aestuariibaculum sp. M13]MCR8667882.1 carboxylesterase family protein [Aestuariibaculum sp. M13]
MQNNRREFLKVVGASATSLGVGGLSLVSCSSKNEKLEDEDKQVVEVSEKGAIVETKYGKIRGFRRNNIYTYKGIPYGDSTAGKNRFMAPIEPKSWAGIRNALAWGNAAPQGGGLGDPMEADFSHFNDWFTFDWAEKRYGEDCLSLNVWTPEINDNTKRPVLVWFHGGGFAGGSSIQIEAYIGENLSALDDVVVVTVNHRLNLFGFLNLREIGGEKYKDSGTAGMLDCVQALKWVNENISNFGGDPSNVTIFGQSGGGAKVSTLMAMPAANGLFHKAVTISGAALKLSSYDTQAQIAQSFIDALGISSKQIDQLQEMSWVDLYKVTRNNPSLRSGVFSPCLDNLNIPQHPFEPQAPLISARIPMIIGSTTAEFSPSRDNPELEDISFEELINRIENNQGGKGYFVGNLNFGEKTRDVVMAYAKAFPNKKPVEIWSLLAGRNGQIKQAKRQSANGGVVYNYLFDWATPLYDGRPRAYHNSDLPFWFNTTDIMDTITGGGSRPRKLAEKMGLALTNFARTGNPNHSGIPHWPAYDDEKGAVMILNDICEVRNDPDREARDLANKILNRS